MQPQNFVTLLKNIGSIKGRYLLDPSLPVPKSFLPELLKDETEEERRNFNVVNKHGSIDIDLTIASYKNSEGDEDDWEEDMKDVLGRKRIGIYVNAPNGNIKFAIHGPKPRGMKRLPFKLTVLAQNGKVAVYLPRSFQGFLTFIIDGPGNRGSQAFELSPEISTYLYTFSEVGKKRRCFIGDYSSLCVDEWEGDEVVVDVKNGGMRVGWDDEVEETRGREKGGLLTRLLQKSR